MSYLLMKLGEIDAVRLVEELLEQEEGLRKGATIAAKSFAELAVGKDNSVEYLAAAETVSAIARAIKYCYT